MNVNKALEQFVINKNITENISDIQDYRCEYLFIDYIKKNDINTYEKIKIDYLKQLKRNIYLEEEVLNLSLEFEKEKLTLIHLKGVILAKEIKLIGKRKINDIDILIPYNQIAEALDLLGKMEYKVMSTGEVVSRNIMKKYLEEVDKRSIHFPEFEKMIEIDGIKYSIKMDCHLSIIHSIKNKEYYMNDMIERCVEVEMENISVKVLELHDRIIHLMLHFTKEVLRCDLRWYITGERWFLRNFKIRLALLHDIALLIEKHEKGIDWNLLEKRCEVLFALDEYYFVINLIKKVYPGLLNIKEEQLMWDKDSSYYMHKYTDMFYGLDYINNDKINFTTDNMSKISETIIKSSLRKDYFECNHEYNICEIHDNLIKGHFISKNNHDSIGRIKFSVDNNNFNIRISSHKMSEITNIFFVIGMLQYNYISKSFINKFQIALDKKDKFGYFLCSINNGNISLNFKCNVKKLDADADNIYISIPRVLSGIDEGYILFDIGFPELEEQSNNVEDYLVNKYKLDDISQKGLGSVFRCNPSTLSTIKV